MMFFAKQPGWRALAVIVAMCGLMGNALAANGSNVPEKRNTVKLNVRDLVDRLEKADPSLKAKIDQSVGYAAFTNNATGVLMFGGFGNGLAKDIKKNKEIYMRMTSPSTGWGKGVKEYSVVFVFETQETLDNFASRGYVLPAEAITASQAAGKGAAEVSPGIWVYQLDAQGIAPALTSQGVKFYVDPQLN
ncbi:hypothetical protein [Silvimonas sp.]|uniref:hypothetical protein n=1 Tax=Silvimonas sp. TaxID=2650811 RepID=UPI002843B1B1|nr:hypothetical protein [Silvimonas sp.]MDR3428950.1 hypothetical protein [Silvimonas sp.]